MAIESNQRTTDAPAGPAAGWTTNQCLRTIWRLANSKKGAAGWVLLAGLGVSLRHFRRLRRLEPRAGPRGFGGMLIATLVMGAMYLCMVLTLAELSAALPTAGGGYSFARRALGPWGGY